MLPRLRQCPCCTCVNPRSPLRKTRIQSHPQKVNLVSFLQACGEASAIHKDRQCTLPSFSKKMSNTPALPGMHTFLGLALGAPLSPWQKRSKSHSMTIPHGLVPANHFPPESHKSSARSEEMLWIEGLVAPAVAPQAARLRMVPCGSVPYNLYYNI